VAWEYDADEPSLEVAASRATRKYEFKAPRRQSVHERAKKEGWIRKASLSGLNAAAHRRADAMSAAAPVPPPTSAPDDGKERPDEKVAPKPDKAFGNSETATLAMEAREEEIDKRAATLKRHRQEWVNVAVLRNEALSLRLTDPVRCSERMRQVKLAAEITAAQQAGERKAWALDIALDLADLSGLSDEALQAIASGRMP
jgi:hypothetical protein